LKQTSVLQLECTTSYTAHTTESSPTCDCPGGGYCCEGGIISDYVQ